MCDRHGADGRHRCGLNIARHAALAAGLPVTTAAQSVEIDDARPA